jgi:hypothetical protein
MHGLCSKFPLSRRGYGAASSLLDLAGLLARPFFTLSSLSKKKVTGMAATDDLRP